jgi:hypothetical protein
LACGWEPDVAVEGGWFCPELKGWLLPVRRTVLQVKKAASPLCIALGVISGKWKPLIFHELRSGTLRYGQRQRRMRLNLTAQINLVNSPLLRMSVGGRFVFVTSHLAHFYGTGSSSPLAFQDGTPI